MTAAAVLDPLARDRAARAEREAAQLFASPARLSLREWGERYRTLGDEPLRFGRTPYLVEILDALDDPGIEEVVVKKNTQAGATKAVLLTLIGQRIDQEPCRMLFVLPSIDEAEKWSKEELARMLEDTRQLHGRVSDPRSRDGANSVLGKEYPGGYLTVVGSNSGRGFRRITADLVVGDDVDGWAETAGTEGDQITLARRRADRSPARKLIWVSSPTVPAPLGRIDKLYESMARRGRFHVPCPHCGVFQVLRWGDRDSRFGLKWESGRPETAYYLCAANACEITEPSKYKIAPLGVYLAGDGQPVRDGVATSAGYWFNALTVTLVGSEWPKLADEWLRVHHDPHARKGFLNTVLAETYVEQNVEVTSQGLRSHRHAYAAEVPAGVGVLTAAVDVQHSWIEVAIWGWGQGEECWLVHHERLFGDPEAAATRERVEAVWRRQWQHESGRKVLVWTKAIDAGTLTTSVVYPWVLAVEKSEQVYAIFGRDERLGQVLDCRLKPNKYGVRPWTVSTPEFKDVLFRRLPMHEHGPGYIHVPAWLDDETLEQFRAEIAETKLHGGRVVRRYVQSGDRNEMIDLWVYGRAALHMLGPTVVAQLGDRAAEWAAPPPKPVLDASAPARDSNIALPPPRSGGGWVNSWRR